ncbi:hypothetical protein [Streptomyces sp. ME19-01-6]|uniref:hypothetical protein n=1 Tax=Streptomyces sp. ME19-01-6 TaxID=3028686 RepID=UPI0029B42ACF|nr:hypothetical protein [Streptomyces sp. ME19-01-6]MDX3231864.1 hypothetical protein [Streptomyces sp. ME19-01-6]
MNGVELVLAALSAGAAAGLTDTASSAVREAYAGLRELVRLRLAARGEGGVRVLEAGESGEAGEVGSDAWRDRLRELLVAVGIDSDEEILAAARSLLRDIGLAEPRDGAGFVDARQAKGVQIGDHNTQTNTFN